MYKVLSVRVMPGASVWTGTAADLDNPDRIVTFGGGWREMHALAEALDQDAEVEVAIEGWQILGESHVAGH